MPRAREGAMMISGEMPKWQRIVHRSGVGFMCVFFAGFGIWNVRLFLVNAAAGRARAQPIGSLLFAAMAVLSIGMQLWYQRRIITEFTFDGSALRFTTLGNSEAQTRALPEIVAVREWRGRGGSLGHRLAFRDGGKAYLSYSVSNATALAEQLKTYVGSG
jgi:hypothetical protein